MERIAGEVSVKALLLPAPLKARARERFSWAHLSASDISLELIDAGVTDEEGSSGNGA